MSNSTSHAFGAHADADADCSATIEESAPMDSEIGSMGSSVPMVRRCANRDEHECNTSSVGAHTVCTETSDLGSLASPVFTSRADSHTMTRLPSRAAIAGSTETSVEDQRMRMGAGEEDQGEGALAFSRRSSQCVGSRSENEAHPRSIRAVPPTCVLPSSAPRALVQMLGTPGGARALAIAAR